MISFAIIVFREVLEIALTLGILLTAMRCSRNCNRWIFLGMGVGVIGALVVAVFAQKISNAMEGMGQEIFNAVVLLIAAFLIIGTVIWMRCHSMQITKELKDVSRAVCEGKKPAYTLAIVMALAVLRDGSEVVMLTYGSLAAGQTAPAIIFGGLLGLTSGFVVGLAICYGLIKFATRYIFNITSWALIFLAAGLVSQAVGFLSAIGYVPELISPVWDTSSIVREHSFIGGVLHTLIGYTDRPSGMQLLCYIMTVFGVVLIIKIYGNISIISNKLKKVIMVALIFIGLSVLCLPKEAQAGLKVYNPYVQKGELEVEVRGNVDFDNNAEKNNLQKQKYALGYGVTSRWFTEVYGEIEKERNDDNEDLDFSFTSVEWENKFQLTEQGQYPVDVGFLLEYEISTEDKHADNLEWSILLDKTIGPIENVANLIFEHEVGGGHTNETKGGFAWSSRYRLDPRFQPGFEYHADFGGFNEGKSFQEQIHQAGPAFYGKFGKNIKYDVGYLFGVSDAAPQGTLKWIIEFEQYF